MQRPSPATGAQPLPPPVPRRLEGEEELPHYFNVPQVARAFVPLIMKEEQKENVHLQETSCKQVHLAPFSNEKIEGSLRHFAGLRKMVREPFSLVLTLRSLPPAHTLYANFDRYTQALGWEMFMGNTQAFRLPEADHDRVWQRYGLLFPM